ncbi:MAG: hypothetical protein HUU02_02430 [Bacteroidetes bacterium]|nr:hypothetical protein [Bacteroidota bacterium]
MKLFARPFLLLLMLTAPLLSAEPFLTVVRSLEQLPPEQRQPVIEKYLNTIRIAPIIENDSILHFVLYGAADSVSVIGDLQRWNLADPMTKLPCGLYSLFYRTYIVPPDARLDYLFIINGAERTDPQNPNITPSGFGPHSEVRMPRFVPTPYLHVRPEVPRGTIDSLAPLYTLISPLRRYVIPTRPIKVYRPAGYDTMQALPAVYVHDGLEALDYMRMNTMLDNMIADGKLQPLIAVFIPPVDREREYLTTSLDRFILYTVREVVGMIDAVYRTDRAPHRRAVIGISAGAHAALYMALTRPDVFLNTGAQSSAVTPQLRLATEQAAARAILPPQFKLYLDCGKYDLQGTAPFGGSYDFLQSHREYSDLLSSLRIPHYYKEATDGHQWASWRERVPGMLTYFFGGR